MKERLTRIDFVIKGEPRSQSRPRFDPVTNRVVSSASTSLKNWRKTVSKVARGRQLEPGPVLCQLIFGLPTPHKERWFKLHSIKPDFDNLAKAVCDELQGEYYPMGDDSQIASGDVIKIWSPRGFVRVIMRNADDLGDVIEFKNEVISVLKDMQRMIDGWKDN